MKIKNASLLLVINICLTFAVCGCGEQVFVSDVSDDQQEAYESEEEIIQDLPMGESTYLNGSVYSAALVATPLHMNLVDSEGTIIPLEERLVSEAGELLEDTTIEDGDISYSPVFKFETEQIQLASSETMRVLMTGLCYWIDNADTIIYDPIISAFRFPLKGDGTFYSVTGYNESEILNLENGDEFLTEYEAWMDKVHEEGTISDKSETTSYDAILTYSVEYPDYFELVYTGAAGYEIYTWPVGTLDVGIREMENGQYEVVESRTYYLDQEFLENTDEYSLELLTEKAGELSVNKSSSIKDAIKDAMTMNASSLNPVVNETIIYVADMPEELKTLIEELSAIANE